MAVSPGEKNKEETVVVKGALTVSHIAGVRDELLKALKSAAKVALDLRAVTEIDLSALQLICSAHKTAIKTQKKFEFIDSSTGVAVNTAGMNGYLRQTGCSIDQDKSCLWNIKRSA